MIVRALERVERTLLGARDERLRFVASLARRRDLGLDRAGLFEPEIELADLGVCRRELDARSGLRLGQRGLHALLRLDAGPLRGARIGDRGLELVDPVAQLDPDLRDLRELGRELGGARFGSIELRARRHAARARFERYQLLARGREIGLELTTRAAELGQLVLELARLGLRGRGGRVRRREGALGTLRADLRVRQLLLRRGGAEHGGRELIGERGLPALLLRRVRRFAQLADLVLEARDEDIGLCEPLRRLHAGAGLRDHLRFARLRQLELGLLELRGALALQPLELAAEVRRLRCVRRLRITDGLHLLEQLADAIDERIALVLDGRACLALHLQPLRERAVQADRGGERAARRQQPEHQASDEDDLPGRHRGALDFLRSDVDAVRAT